MNKECLVFVIDLTYKDVEKEYLVLGDFKISLSLSLSPSFSLSLSIYIYVYI